MVGRFELARVCWGFKALKTFKGISLYLIIHNMIEAGALCVFVGRVNAARELLRIGLIQIELGCVLTPS